jgi:hypothetical protein
VKKIGYKMTIDIIELQANGLKEIPSEITDTLWKVSGNKIDVTDSWINWDEKEMRKNMAILARAGVTGEMQTFDEYASRFKYVFNDGKVELYEGVTTWPDVPEWTS